MKKTGVISYNKIEYEVPYQYASIYINLVLDPHTQQVKYLESLTGEKIGEVVQLDPISNAYRDRQRPGTAKPKPHKSSSVVEEVLNTYQNRYKLEDK